MLIATCSLTDISAGDIKLEQSGGVNVYVYQ
jgi:hypothetical protein